MSLKLWYILYYNLPWEYQVLDYVGFLPILLIFTALWKWRKCYYDSYFVEEKIKFWKSEVT